MNSQRAILIIAILVVLIFLGYWFWPSKVKEEGAVGVAKNVSEAVPKIQTNLGENVPEVNPLDRANPFKYKNPLR
ncbi:MAG: hypothetical protein AAB474_02470 [Patescibacteria group bacterium]